MFEDSVEKSRSTHEHRGIDGDAPEMMKRKMGLKASE